MSIFHSWFAKVLINYCDKSTQINKKYGVAVKSINPTDKNAYSVVQNLKKEMEQEQEELYDEYYQKINSMLICIEQLMFENIISEWSSGVFIDILCMCGDLFPECITDSIHDKVRKIEKEQGESQEIQNSIIRLNSLFNKN